MTQTTNAKWGFPPTCHLILNSRQPQVHGLLSGNLLHDVFGESAHQLLIELPNFFPPGRGLPALGHVHLDVLPGCSIGFGIFLHLDLARPSAIGLLDRAVPLFGRASSIRFPCHWSLPSMDGCWELMAYGACGHEALIWSSVTSPKKHAKSVGNSSVSPRSSVRLNQTCFCVGPLANTWWLILVGNRGILQHALEHCLAVSC